jgi:hypothetical protein
MTDRKSHRFEMVDDAMAAILRKKTEAERLAIIFGLWKLARDLVRADVRSQHPEWGDLEVDRAVARRLSHGAV